MTSDFQYDAYEPVSLSPAWVADLGRELQQFDQLSEVCSESSVRPVPNLWVLA